MDPDRYGWDTDKSHVAWRVDGMWPRLLTAFRGDTPSRDNTHTIKDKPPALVYIYMHACIDTRVDMLYVPRFRNHGSTQANRTPIYYYMHLSFISTYTQVHIIHRISITITRLQLFLIIKKNKLNASSLKKKNFPSSRKKMSNIFFFTINIIYNIIFFTIFKFFSVLKRF